MALPQFLPIPDAAKQLGLTETELRARVKAGKIAAGILPDGEIIVNTDANGLPADDINARLRAIRREDFEHLRGKAITVTGAAEKYSKKYGVEISRVSIWDWVNQGYITVVKSGYRAEVDESDVAFCAAIHSIRKQYKSRAPLIDSNGKPYMLKHPQLAKARRNVKFIVE